MRRSALVIAVFALCIVALAIYLGSSACDELCFPLQTVEQLAAAGGDQQQHPDITAKLPNARPQQPWPYRPLDSAHHSIQLTSNTHALVATVQHAVIPGVTLNALLWFFNSGVRENRTYKGDGQEWPVYLQWHPRDHIEQTLAPQPTANTAAEDHSHSATLWWICEFLMCSEPGGFTSSSYSQLQPAQRAQEHLATAVAEVKQLDGRGLVMSLPSSLGLGDTFWRLTHDWVDTAGGVLINSSQVVGVVEPGWRPRWFARLRNAIVRGRFRQASGDPVDLMQRWVHHCVEEFGNLQHILPEMYAAAVAARPHVSTTPAATSAVTATQQRSRADEL